MFEMMWKAAIPSIVEDGCPRLNLRQMTCTSYRPPLVHNLLKQLYLPAVHPSFKRNGSIPWRFACPVKMGRKNILKEIGPRQVSPSRAMVLLSSLLGTHHLPDDLRGCVRCRLQGLR